MRFIKITAAFAVTMYLLTAFKSEEITWVAIGDSITYLNDHTNETGGRVTKGYLTRVIEHFSSWHYTNKGYNGWTSGKIAENIENLSINKADIYSVFLGTNDWWQGRPVGVLNDYKTGNGNSTLYGSFRIIINKIRRLNPVAQVVLITPLQRVDFVYVNDQKNNAYGSYKPKNGQTLEAFANAIDSIGMYEHIPVVDLYHDKKFPLKDLVNFKRLKDPISGSYKDYNYPASTAIPFNAATDEYPYPKNAIKLTYDGLHPSDKGNKIIAKRLIDVFSAIRFPLISSVDSAKFGKRSQ